MFSFYTLGHIGQFKSLFFKNALKISDCNYATPLDFLFSKTKYFDYIYYISTIF